MERPRAGGDKGLRHQERRRQGLKRSVWCCLCKDKGERTVRKKEF